MTREHALKLRAMIEQLSASVADKDALETIELFPVWKSGKAYHVGDRYRRKDVLYRCLVDHTAQDGWSPDVAPSLWAKVLIPDADVIPEWEQPNSTNPYMTGDKVMFSGSVWECIVDNNVWSPDVYGWQQI